MKYPTATLLTTLAGLAMLSHPSTTFAGPVAHAPGLAMLSLTSTSTADPVLAARANRAADECVNANCKTYAKINIDCANAFGITANSTKPSADTVKKATDCICTTDGFWDAFVACQKVCEFDFNLEEGKAKCEAAKGSNPASSWREGRYLLGAGASFCIAALMTLA